MSLTIRFMDGKTITYNSANYLMSHQDRCILYSAEPAKGGTWVASIQASVGAIVEAVAPCNIYPPPDLREAIRQVNSALETNSINGEGRLLRKTKRLLKRFNSYTCKMK